MTSESLKRLNTYHPRQIEREGFRRAGVLVPLVRLEKEIHLVFIRRSKKLSKHAGQIAFPGGGEEEQDESLWATALREGNEEVGIEPDQVQLLGRLDHVWTPSRFVMHPFAVELPSMPHRACIHEVDEIFSLPVRRLMEPGVFRVQFLKRGSEEYRLVFFDIPDYVVWGATGRITENFLQVAYQWKP